MEKLHTNVRQIFKSAQFQNKPLTDCTLAQEFIRAVIKLGYTHDQLAMVTNCNVYTFSHWCRRIFPRHDSQFERETHRIQTWLNQHLETESPKPLPADITVGVALATEMKNPQIVFVPSDSRVQDIPKFIYESQCLPLKSELDVESLTLRGETLEWTRPISSYAYSFPMVILVHLKT